MKKILFGSIFVLIILVVVTGIYTAQKPVPVPVIVTPLPNATTTPITVNGVQVVTPEGKVTIADIRTLSGVADVGENMYHLEGTQNDIGAGFAILYSAADSSFSVAIEKTPISLYRERASRYFLQLFHVSESDACKLHVLVGVPAEIDSKLAGQNLGLSFCPGSITLP